MNLRPAIALTLLAGSIQAEEVVMTTEQLRKFGQEYCFQCHNAEKQKGDFNFESHLIEPNVLKDQKVWEKIAEVLEKNEMPPENKMQPSQAERLGLIQWIDSQLGQEEGKSGPGRVTLRRLNRDEYRNTIRDLLGVEVNPEEFPSDETAYGYDTIAEALTLPPLLMEKYLDAAESIVNKVIAVQKTDTPAKQIKGTQFRGSNEDVREAEEGVIGFYREGEAVTDVELPKDGEYLLRVRAYGDQAGPEAPKLAVSLDGEQIGVVEVKASDKPGTYEVKATAKGGKRKLTLAFLNNFKDENSDRNAYVSAVEVLGPINSQPKTSEGFQRVFTKLPAPGEEAKVARELLRNFATRAFRRTATDEEVERLGKLVDSAMAEKAPFTEAMGLAMQATLSSPSFLFRWELDPSTMKAGETRALNDFEVASRLSYFLWGTMPDQELFELASKGELLQGDNLSQQTARLVQDKRSNSFIKNFSSQWLQIRAIEEVEIDEKKYPKYNSQLREAMKEESRLFFDAIVRENRNIYDLVGADFTFVNQRLAELYGIEEVKGDKFQRVQLPADSPRGGILGQGAVLVSTSLPSRTSPVIRGKWVLEQILGTPPPPAPANVPPLEATKVDKDAPMRQRLEQHRQNADCAVCHDKIDPAGFALENFDAIGAWRTQDGNSEIDPSGVFPGGHKVNGVADLKKYLRNEKFARNFVQQMMTYALGRGLGRTDKASVDAVVAKMNAGGDKMNALIEAIVTSEPFLKRQHELAAR